MILSLQVNLNYLEARKEYRKVIGVWGRLREDVSNFWKYNISDRFFSKKISKKGCRNLAKGWYGEKLEEALDHPSVWQLGGYDSAWDYAETRSQTIFSSCMN